MELKDFISETIYQIATGVRESMDKCKGLDVLINPNICGLSGRDFYIPQNTSAYQTSRRIMPIEMDVSVVVSNSSESSAGGKIGMSMLGIGGDIKGSDNTTNSNRIKFTIPVSLPVTNIKNE